MNEGEWLSVAAIGAKKERGGIISPYLAGLVQVSCRERRIAPLPLVILPLAILPRPKHTLNHQTHCSFLSSRLCISIDQYERQTPLKNTMRLDGERLDQIFHSAPSESSSSGVINGV